MRNLLAAVLIAVPFAAFAVGSDDGVASVPPKPTETTRECEDGQVRDEKTKPCIDTESQLLDNDQRSFAVRELAYAGPPAEAMAVLDTMTEGKTARVMTYRGFLLHKTGKVEAGIAACEEAVRIDPANILARSDHGQLLVGMNELQLASVQLDAIRQNGGSGSWAERALSSAIANAITYSF